METFEQFNRQFPTDEACKAYIVQRRWPNGVHCPRCQRQERVYALKTPFRWTCCNADCGGRKGYRFSVTTGTIFSDTKVSLRIWFQIGYLMLTAKKGMSSLQVRRVIFGEHSGTDWRTAWYICHRWRAAMHGDMFPMDGIIEVDETYVGGKDRNRHWGKKSAQQRKAAGPRSGLERPGGNVGYGKVGVIGAIERKGSVVARVIGGMDARTMSGFVRTLANDLVSLVITDEAPTYENMGLPHESVSHTRNEYVRGNVHTNNIESFWSLLKRGVVGTYHKVSKDYLPLYLNEFSYRHNNRDNPDAFADLITTCDQ
jgi:transposase-like protein/IS1 family transposase